jgi:hypothetical protein
VRYLWDSNGYCGISETGADIIPKQDKKRNSSLVIKLGEIARIYIKKKSRVPMG